jgi:hypothetical protein
MASKNLTLNTIESAEQLQILPRWWPSLEWRIWSLCTGNPFHDIFKTFPFRKCVDHQQNHYVVNPGHSTCIWDILLSILLLFQNNVTRGLHFHCRQIGKYIEHSVFSITTYHIKFM